MTARDFAVVVLVLALIGIVLCLVAMAVRWVMSRRAAAQFVWSSPADSAEVESVLSRVGAEIRMAMLEARVCAELDEAIAELREVGIEVRA